ncbi:hypothetical protein KY290_010431 [Solanum tuberosum]|nr:hypothetical protein KY284_010341 [Solanum tuberosum]KAH0773294.1 hypothetical protein KY290_010431 [Solanum tuberosum]
MTIMVDKNSQTDKELCDIREVMNQPGLKGKDKEAGRAESSTDKACSRKLQQDTRAKENHKHCNFITVFSRLDFPKFSGQELRK